MGDKDAAHEWQGGAGGSGLTDAERRAAPPATGRLDDLRSGHNVMEDFLAPAEKRHVSPPRMTRTKLTTARTEPTIEGIGSYRDRVDENATLGDYLARKAMGVVVQGVEEQLREAAQKVQALKLVAQETYHALPSDVKRTLIPVKDGITAVGQLIGKGVAMFERVGETVGTYVRRKTRDDWSVLSQSDAQDLGVLAGYTASFLAADVLTRGAVRGFTAVKAGANALRRAEFLSAFEGAGSGSGIGPLLRTEIGAVNMGAVATEVTEVSVASSKLTPTLQALGLESGPKTLTLLEQKIASGEWRIVDGRTIRKGQEWKTLIHGRGQKTKTPGHAMESAKVAVQMAKSGEYQAVHLDRGYHRILRDAGHDVKLPVNRRPDVVGTKHGGREFDVVEVRSKTDRPKDLTARNLQVRDQLQPAGITVNKPDVKKIPTWDYKKGAPRQ